MPRAAGSPLPPTCTLLDLLVAPSTGLSAGAGVMEVEENGIVPSQRLMSASLIEHKIMYYDLISNIDICIIEA